MRGHVTPELLVCPAWSSLTWLGIETWSPMMKHLFGILILASAVALMACGSEDSTDSSTDGSDSGTQTATSDWDATPAADATVHEVLTTDTSMDFEPEDLTIAAGDVVRFVMSATHNAIQVSQETYDERGSAPVVGGFEVQFGQTREITFTEPGVYYYVCQPHTMLEMIGTVTVQ